MVKSTQKHSKKKHHKQTKKMHKQKIYSMVGCSKKRGGGNSTLAYPSTNVPKIPNPFLAYTGKSHGGSKSAIYPSLGPKNPLNNIFLNPTNTTKGGSCGSCQANLLKGGNNMSSYPNGLIGKAWTPNPSGWPGVTNNASYRNHLGYNTYSPVDISRQMVGGKYKNKTRNSNNINRKNINKKKKGGALSNFIVQDFVNLGRQTQHGLGNTYNILKGNPLSPSPLPWKDQFYNNK